MSAVRNLAGRELNGRPLRIDSASNAPGGEGVKSTAAGPGGPVEVHVYVHVYINIYMYANVCV